MAMTTAQTRQLDTLHSDFAAVVRSWGRSLYAKSPATQSAYLTAAVQLGQFLEERGMPTAVESITGEHVREFLRDQIETRSASTARSRHAFLSAFFRWLVDEGEIRDSPMRRVQAPTVEDRPPAILDDASFERLEKACAGRAFEDRRDLAVIRLLDDTGIRRAKCAGIKLSDLDFDALIVTVTGKGRRVRICAFTPETGVIVDRYLRVRAKHPKAGSPNLWLGRAGPTTPDGIADIVESRAAIAGLRGVHAHMLRHRFADRWKRAGGSEEDLMALGGWRSRTVMARYGRAHAASRAIAAYRRIRPGDGS